MDKNDFMIAGYLNQHAQTLHRAIEAEAEVRSLREQLSTVRAELATLQQEGEDTDDAEPDA